MSEPNEIELGAEEPIEKSAPSQEPRNTVSAPGVPQFRNQREPLTIKGKAVQTNPEETDYDALVLAQNVRIAPAKVFALEPRRKEWSSGAEETVRSVLARQVSMGTRKGRVGSVECRSLSCRVEIIVPADEKKTASLVGGRSGIGDYCQMDYSVIEATGDVSLSWTCPFANEERDLGVFRRNVDARWRIRHPDSKGKP